MTDPAWELQMALVARLTAWPALITAMEGVATVLDHIPEGQAMPYVELEDGEASENDTGRGPTGNMEYSTEHRLRFFSWSDYEGKKQAKAMNRAIIECLRDAEDAITLSGHKLINIRNRFGYVLRDPALQTYYGVTEFRAVTEEL